MILHFKITSIDIRTRIGESARSTILLGIQLDEYQHFVLKTGEILQNPNRTRDSGDKNIAASLAIFSTNDSVRNQMFYHQSSFSGDSEIGLNVYAKEVQFHELLENIRAGIFPDEVTVHFDSNQILHGREPDGSGMSLDNRDEESQSANIRAIEIKYGMRGAETRKDEK